jgi:hypothetical protein
MNVAGLVAVIAGEAVPRIVQLVVGIDERFHLDVLKWIEQPPERLRPVEHPVERDVGQTILRISASDVGMNADEPDLAEPLFVDVLELVLPFRGNLGLPLRIDCLQLSCGVADVSFIPDDRPECISLILERERMARSMNFGIHEPIRH